MTPQQVLVPCRRFEVEVVLGPHDGLSIIEQTILRLAAVGRATVDEVAALLHIPPRMVLDASVDLLARGLVDVQLDGTLLAVPEVVEAMGEPASPKKDWFAAFQSGNVPEAATVHLVQDLVAGEVFRYPRVPLLERERLPIMPENAEIPSVDEIPLATLLAAVTRALLAFRSESAFGDDLHADAVPRDARVLQVKLRRTGASGPPAHLLTQRALLQASVLASEQGDDEPPRVAIVDPEWIPLHVRAKISSTLAGLWLRGFGRGRGQFFERLDASVDAPSSHEQPTVAPHAIELVQAVETLLADEKRPSEAAHRDLVVADAAARPHVEHLSAYSAPATLMLGRAADFRSAMLEALASAERQVVLASPWMTQLDRSDELREAIERATARGVHVVVIWGIERRQRRPDEPGWDTLARLGAQSRGSSGAVVYCDRGAGSHAKLIVCDLDWMVLSSCNFLSASPEKQQREVGIRVTASDGVVPLAMQEILGWARRLMPDYLVQQRCVDLPALFGRVESRPILSLDDAVIGPPQLLFGDVGVEIWRRAWTARVTGLRDMLTMAQDAVVPVFDRGHREALILAVSTARKRLSIESHRVSAQGLSEPIVDELERAISRGVEVRLVHDASTEIDPTAKQRLLRLSTAGATVSPRDTHAKTLVCDDWAVVASHNFLSVESGTRSARELGVQVFTRPLVDALWESTRSA